MFLVIMDCIVSVHYKDSDFELDQCDVHRKKRHVGEHEKELEYKVELIVEEPGESAAVMPGFFIGLFLPLFIF